MHTLILATAIAATTLLGAGAAGAAAKPTVVLVHGAFADSSSWNGVIEILEQDGYPVVAAANPLRGVRSDADQVAAVVKSIGGPVVLVGHSYGGLVISEAATGAPEVIALVYVGAFAPEPGESAASLSGKFPGSTLASTLAPPVPLPDGGADLYIAQDKFPAQFAADVPESAAKLMAAEQRPITDAALNEPSTDPAWHTIPSWFIYGEKDRNIPAAVHAFMAERAGAKQTVAVEGASHVVMVSNPRAVAEMIEAAATAE